MQMARMMSPTSSEPTRWKEWWADWRAA